MADNKFADNHLNGMTDEMDRMKKMVLTVFREHPEMTKGEIEQYIKDNL